MRCSTVVAEFIGFSGVFYLLVRERERAFSSPISLAHTDTQISHM